ncbi:CU044_5270 family protein [Actinocorallia longicatena]|uniref:CU044_5270 family protein n=1 Tax=Actinocorallia longicatena TaxID=111803 RepID=A0ABP6QKQ1_9ACTN
MNPMDELRNAKPEYLETPTPATTRLRELNYAMAQQQTSTTRQKKFRPALGLGVIGAVAAGTAAAALVLSGGGAAPVKTPAPPLAGSSKPAVKVNGHEILLVAAENAEKQPKTAGKWWHTSSIGHHLSAVEGADYKILDRERSDLWTPLATGGDSFTETRKLAFGFPSKADEDAWKAAGSPATLTVKMPAVKGMGTKRGYEVSSQDGPAETGHSPLFQGDKVFWIGKNVTMKELLGLPGTPKALKAHLLRWYGGHDTESSSVPMTSDAWLFRVTTGLIADMPVSPQVRGAAFRMLSELKSVKVVPDVRTADGRTGTAVSINEDIKIKANAEADGSYDSRLIFDVATGTALQTDNVVVEPGGYQADLQPGDVSSLTTIATAGWTDRR